MPNSMNTSNQNHTNPNSGRVAGAVGNLGALSRSYSSTALPRDTTAGVWVGFRVAHHRAGRRPNCSAGERALPPQGLPPAQSPHPQHSSHRRLKKQRRRRRSLPQRRLRQAARFWKLLPQHRMRPAPPRCIQLARLRRYVVA
jgi:hypothetical protein